MGKSRHKTIHTGRVRPGQSPCATQPPGAGSCALIRSARIRPAEGDDRRINRWARQRDLYRSPAQVMDLETGEIIDEHDQVATRLARAGERAGEVWLWCLHCNRFFQAKHLKLDFLGDWQQCPFEDCGAAGFDVDIYLWDAWRHGEPDWPGSDGELRFGMQYPPERPGLWPLMAS